MRSQYGELIVVCQVRGVILVKDRVVANSVAPRLHTAPHDSTRLHTASLWFCSWFIQSLSWETLKLKIPGWEETFIES